MTIDRVSGSALVLLGLFVMWERRVLPLGTHGQPGPGYLPLLLAILLVILGGLLVRGAEAPRRSAPSSGLRPPTPSRSSPAPSSPRGCSNVSGIAITLVIVLGFLFGVMERLRLWQVATLTLGLSFGTFWLFDSLLRVPLPRGGWGF